MFVSVLHRVLIYKLPTDFLEQMRANDFAGKPLESDRVKINIIIHKNFYFEMYSERIPP